MAAPVAADSKLHPFPANRPAPSKRYEYEALPAGGWTRILELHPGAGTLTSNLKHAKTEDATLAYEALSYVWGSDALQNQVDIECDGQVLSIGSNLASALMHVRSESVTRQLWVDAICIDQGNKDERSQLVQQMDRIYANAKRVLVWLGEDPAGEADECLSLIQDTNAILMDMLSRYEKVEDIPPISYGKGSICADPLSWDKVRRLMSSAWFGRVWVLQEIGLARSAIILYGKYSMDWSQLVELMLFNTSRVDVGAHTGTISSGKIWDVYEDIWCTFKNETSWRNELPLTKSLNQAHSSQCFTEILNVARHYQATDPRDHVYAFFGHPSAGEGWQLQSVDYSMSVDRVYLEVASHILMNDPQSWTVLSCVDHKPDSPSLCGQRPSWVPRWEEGWHVYTLGYQSMWYRAGGCGPEPFQASLSRSGSSLSVQGVLFDTIVWTSESFKDEELKIEPQRKGAPLQRVWRELEQHQVISIYGPRSEDREYAYSLMLIAGRAADDGPAEDKPSLQKSVYQKYKNLFRTNPEDSELSLAERADETNEVRIYTVNQRRALHNRRIFLTSKGYYGVGHNLLEIGDKCLVIRGANVPFVIRKTQSAQQISQDSRQYRLIGEAYIQGIMKGEVFDNNSNVTELDIDII